MSWFNFLQRASWRGVPFAVLTGEGEFGRRIALHEYPFRDTVWAEDIGRSARHIELIGFLIGDDVIAQRERMIAAAEQAGPGQLIHPTLGALTVSLARPMRPVERFDKGRYFEIHFSFVESGQRIFPATLVSTGAAVLNAAQNADLAAGVDFATVALAALKLGAQVAQMAATTVAIWALAAQRLGNDATNMNSLIAQLPGNYGRYFNGRNAGGFSSAVQETLSISATVSSLIQAGSAARASIAASSLNLNAVAGALSL